MTKFMRAKVPDSEFEKVRKALLEKGLSWFEAYLGRVPTEAEKVGFINMTIADLRVDQVWKNDVYQVAMRSAHVDDDDFPEMWHLSIKRIDKEPIHDWRDLQAIKDELVGPENEGVELYPAHSRVIDTANQYHLFVLKEPKVRFPFGWGMRVVQDYDFSLAGSKQRRIAEDE